MPFTNTLGTLQLGSVVVTNSPTVSVTNYGTVVEINKGTINLGTMAISALPSGGTILNLASGTLAAVTTLSNLTNGTVNVNTGTINVGTFVHPTGTVTTIVAGTQNTLGTVGVLNTGTLLSSGTTTGVGVVTTVTTVSNLTHGTIDAGTVDTELPAAAALSDSIGNPTTPMIGGALMAYNGATWERVHGEYSTADALAVQSGIYSLPLNRIYNGATWDRMRGDALFNLKVVPGAYGTSLMTLGTTGAAVWGTLVAASGAGTKQYVSGVDISVVSGTVEVAVTNIGVGGSAGAGVLARGAFIAGGGISKNFNPIQASGTNGTLAYWLGGAGTVDITIQYWQST